MKCGSVCYLLVYLLTLLKLSGYVALNSKELSHHFLEGLRKTTKISVSTDDLQIGIQTQNLSNIIQEY